MAGATRAGGRLSGPDPLLWLGLGALALVTSTLSAVVGLAGGILLLAAMLIFLEPLVAIPVHGVVQLASNLSRAYLQRRHVRWDAAARFALLLVPAGLLGLLLVQRIPAEIGRLGIGIFALVTTWAPAIFRWGTRRAAVSAHRFLWAGALVGFSNMLFGATGPLLAPFVLSLGVAREATIGTLAACQTLGHTVKVGLFGAGGFDFAVFALPALGLSAAAIAGSALGTRLLAGIEERYFRIAIRTVLTLVALRLIWKALA